MSIVAPAEDILTTCYDGQPYFDYCLQDGTSFAGPHVASAAALARTYDQDMTPDEFRTLLEETAGLPWTPELGYGPLRFDKIAERLGLGYPVFLPVIAHTYNPEATVGE